MTSMPQTVGDIMTRCPVVVRPHQSLAEAHALMRSRGIRHLPVVDCGRIIGVVSQGDLRLLESIGEMDPATVPVEEAMIHHPYSVEPGAPLADVLAHMLERHLGAALVVDRNGLIGIFTSVDAMAALRRLVADPASTTTTKERS